jgi:hypothetical protein
MLYFWPPSQVWFFFFPSFFGWVAEFGTGFYGLLASNFRAFFGNSNLTAAPWVGKPSNLIELWHTECW